HVLEQRGLQDLRNVDRRRLQKHVHLRPTLRPAPFDQEDRVLVPRFEDEGELRLQLLAATDVLEDLFRLLLHAFEIGGKARQSADDRGVLVAVLFKEFSARGKSEAGLSSLLRNEREEKLAP